MIFRIIAQTIAVLFTLTFSGLSFASDDSETNPTSLSLGTWVCKSPQIYETIVAEQATSDLSAFKLAKKYEADCIYMDDDNLEDMLPPYVTVLGEEGDKSRVSFFVEFYKRIEFLHRQIKHVKFTGWTASENIVALYN